MRSTTDQLFGLGAGCEGAMDVLLTRVSAADELAAAALHGEAASGAAIRAAWLSSSRAAKPTSSSGSAFPPMAHCRSCARTIRAASCACLARCGRCARRTTPSCPPHRSTWNSSSPSFAPPPHLLLLGGGPDARPVATLAAFLGWRVIVVDHRAAYLDPARFPASDPARGNARAEDVAEAVPLDDSFGGHRHEPPPGFGPALPARAGAHRRCPTWAC